MAKLPSIVAFDQRRRHGEDADRTRRASLGFAANFLQMCFGSVPEPEIVKAFEVSLILYAEHGFNASTFTGRVVTSTMSDLYSAVTAAIGALKGPLHGGANEAVMYMLLEIEEPDKAAQWIHDALARKAKIMGFGHRVYKHGDSRVPTMAKSLEQVAALKKADKLMALYAADQEGDAGREGHPPQPRLPDRARLLPDGLRHPGLHPAVRPQPDHRLDRAHHRAAELQLTDQTAEQVRRPEQRSVPAR